MLDEIMQNDSGKTKYMLNIQFYLCCNLIIFNYLIIQRNKNYNSLMAALQSNEFRH